MLTLVRLVDVHAPRLRRADTRSADCLLRYSENVLFLVDCVVYVLPWTALDPVSDSL